MTTRRVVWLTAAVLTVVLATGCAVRTSGAPLPVGESGSERPSLPGKPGQPSKKKGEQRAPDDYQAPEDGSGYAKEPHDQAPPVPGYTWQGWGRHSRCDWLPPDLMAPLATGPIKQAGHFCHVPVAGGDELQILWGGSYGRLFEPAAFMRPETVAGLEARAFDLPANAEAYPGSCHIKVHTRSLSSFSVLNWNPQKKPGDREARCKVAKQGAELIARRMVPAAGGTAWPQTPQRPSQESIAGRDACKIVTDLETTFAGVSTKPSHERTDAGDTCTYEQRGKRVVALLTEGPDQGLAQVPAPDDAKVTPRKLGGFEARQEIVDQTCAVTTEFVPGRLLRVEYGDDLDNGDACKAAEVVAVEAVLSMLERS